MRKELKEQRVKRGWTQEDVAKKCNVTRAFYGHIETGKRNPTLKLAFRIAKLFNESVENLF
ncbi:MAG: helix-turn-helix transcriptional regulator [archaeon]